MEACSAWIETVEGVVLWHFPDATIADLCDWAGCSRETAHWRRLLAYRINADWDAKLAARRAVARQQSP